MVGKNNKIHFFFYIISSSPNVFISPILSILRTYLHNKATSQEWGGTEMVAKLFSKKI